MGSGLILLGIVGAWLAVLVPMALRSHDTTTSLSSVDRFSDAMRVLSRREQQGRGAARSFVLPPRAAVPCRPTVPLAVRRRRVLLTLVGLAVLTLLLAVLGLGWALLAHLILDCLAAAYVAHLRKQAIVKAERSIRSAADPVARARRPVAHSAPMRIAGVPERMPSRPEPLHLPVTVPAARYEDPQPGALGDVWSPHAVPIPTYVTAPVAPPRPPRVLDLTRPGEWTAAAAGNHEDDELDDILEPRRASGDW